jgi:hypothetical protein
MEEIFLCFLLNKGLVILGRQTYIHTAEPLMSKPNASEVERTIEKVKRHKSPGIDQIPAELINACSRTTRSEIHKRIYYIWNKERLPEE